MSERRFRIGAVHALMNSIEPTQAAFDRHWPVGDVAHLLDGSLYLDRNRGTADAAVLADRIDRLIRYSVATGAEAVLFTGSFFGAAVRQAQGHVGVPVLTSFDGLVERALSLDRPLCVISTAAESARLLVAELEHEAARRSRHVSLSSKVVTGAMDALVQGDAESHDRLVIEAIEATEATAATDAMQATEAVTVFAQFSMERVLDRCAALGVGPVIGPATEGTTWLRQLVMGSGR